MTHGDRDDDGDDSNGDDSIVILMVDDDISPASIHDNYDSDDVPTDAEADRNCLSSTRARKCMLQ